jgi:hypothetical protein
MTDTPTPQPTITFDLPDAGGPVTMIGRGPWRTVEIGHSKEVRDADGLVANPTVLQKFSGTTLKPNANVVFARPSITQAIVDKANEQLAAATA